MAHYYGSSQINTADFPREGRQGIDTAQPRQVGETFNARTNLLTKIGSAFSLFTGGKRYGSARVVGEPCKDPRYQVGPNPDSPNMADHVYAFQVEHSDYSPEPDGNDYELKPKGRWDSPYV